MVNPNKLSFHSIKKACCPFLELFSHDLSPGHFRVFRRGPVYLSLWQCDDVRICATNAVVPISTSSVAAASSSHFGTNLVKVEPLPPVLSDDLNRWPLEHLKLLAARLGFSDGGTKSEIISRICGRASDVDSISLPASSSSQASYEGETVIELKERLYKLGLRTSGNKEQLIERLRRATTASNDISKAKNEVRAFLGSAGTVADDERPFINGLYKSNFNLVDHFNQLLAGIEYRCRISTEAQRVIISVAQFAVTVCYVLCEDNRQRSVRYPPVPTSVRAFALELAMSLMRSEEPFLKNTSEE